MLKNLFKLACLSLIIIPGCQNNNNKESPYEVEDQYTKEIVYQNNDIRQINFYDYENGLKTVTHSKTYNAGKFLNETYDTFEYKNKLPIKQIQSNFDYTDETVQSSNNQCDYAYDANNNVIHKLITKTNSKGDLSWDSYACTYTYDSNNNIVEQYETVSSSNSTKDSTAFVSKNISKMHCTYDSQNRPIDYISYVCTGFDEDENPIFAADEAIHYSYEHNKRIVNTYTYNFVTGEPDAKNILIELYDDDNNVIEAVSYSYRMSSTSPKPTKGIYRVVNVYGANHCCTRSTTYSIASKTGEVVTADICTTYLNNNPNKILNQTTIAEAGFSGSISNLYDSKNRIVKSTTLSVASKKVTSTVHIYSYD